MASRHVPWVEKYRPTDLNEVIDQDTVVWLAKKLIKMGLPINVIFVGPPGTGKTTIARIIAKEILGNFFNSNFLEVNASDEFRMAYVRTYLKDFIKQYSPNRIIKIILLEEADNIPTNTQQAMRRRIESSHKDCRYIMTCNYLSNIIDPIQSRCVIIRLSVISKNGVNKAMINILGKESSKIQEISEEFVSELTRNTRGDMRLAINTLQTIDLEDPINSLYKMLGIIHPSTLRAIQLMILKGNFTKIVKKLNIMNKISPQNFLYQLEDNFVKSNLSDEHKAQVCQIIADCDKRLTTSSDQEVQLLGCIAKLCIILRGE